MFSLLLFILALNCDDGPTGSGDYTELFPSERNQYALYGTIVDQNNIPVPNAEVHYTFGPWQGGKIAKSFSLKNTNPSTTISFSVPAEGQTSLRVYRFGTREVIATLIDTILRAGQYSFPFNAQGITNGMYVYKLKTGEQSYQNKMSVMNFNYDQLRKTQPLARTDYQGKFILPFKVLGIGEEILQTNESGSGVIGKYKIDSIAVVVFHSGKSSPLVEGFSVDPTHDVTRIFIMK